MIPQFSPYSSYSPPRLGARELVRFSEQHPGVFEAMTPNAFRNFVGGDSLSLFETQTALANLVRPDISPQELRRINTIDKGLAMAGGMKQFKDHVDDARLEGYDQWARGIKNLRDRLMAAGSLFP